MTFEDFGLREEITKAIAERNFTSPTEIQEKLIPFLMEEKKDLVGLAQTGTGKTAAFGLPLVQFARPGDRDPRGLVLSPTRELCLQIAGDLKSFAKYLPGIHVIPVYGGAPITGQIRDLYQGCQIVVATPGRLLDLIKRGRIDLEHIEHLVLDEADIMLNMGFKEELDAILAALPENRTTLLLSATMPPEVARIAEKYMRSPQRFVAGKENAGAEGIEHFYFMIHEKDRYSALKRLLDYNPDIYGIVFCRTKIATQEIADKLIKDGYNAQAIHSDLSQSLRDAVMAKFRARSFPILVATDVAARGIDVSDLSHIIHYDLPDDSANYVHRSGRTGRAGRSGESLILINMREKHKIRQIERTLDREIHRSEIPSGKEICAKQLLHLIDRVHTVRVDEDQIAPYMETIEEKLAALGRDELLKHFVSLEFNHFLDYYKNAPDLQPVVREKRMEKERSAAGRWDSSDRRPGPGAGPGAGAGRRKAPAGGNLITVKINLGRQDRVLPPDIIQLVNRQFGGEHVPLGRISIEKTFSVFQIEKGRGELLAKNSKAVRLKGRTVKFSM